MPEIKMAEENVVSRHLKIPVKCIRRLSASRLVCLVTEEWLGNFSKGIFDKDLLKNSVPSTIECEQLLAPSTICIKKPLMRICVKVINKSNNQVSSIEEQITLCHSLEERTLLSHLSQVDHENFNILWAKTFEQYGLQSGNKRSVTTCKFTEKVVAYLQRINPKLSSQQNRRNTPDHHSVPNMVPVIDIAESNDCLFVVQPYLPISVLDMTLYSPAIISFSNIKPLFILYQVLNSLKRLHEINIPVGDISMKKIRIDEKLWVSITNPVLSQPFFKTIAEESISSDNENKDNAHCPNLLRMASEVDTMVEKARKFLKSLGQYSIKDLPRYVEDWTKRKISNFEYLMILNTMAGRRMLDPNHHPVIPWVTDFTEPDGKLRDLSKSKYRLNKGDDQLELTFESMSALDDENHVPHHISDVLSDITYYVYKARRTPKEILCKHVRSKWVPNEYPSSMQRVQEWTPDECIPEFFTDSSIFTSMHEDLPNLQLPAWCNTAEDFICKHMEILESESVSEKLNKWIDLTFGYKLSGSSAVSCKNVNLRLVDNHKNVTSYGVTQLFTTPHPHRVSLGKLASSSPPRFLRNILDHQYPFSDENYQSTGKRYNLLEQGGVSVKPEQARILLSKTFDPLADLDQLEAVYNFTMKTMKSVPTQRKKEFSSNGDPHQNFAVRDMQLFGCFMCELFLAPHLRFRSNHMTLHDRYVHLFKLYQENVDLFPRILSEAVQVILQFDEHHKLNFDPAGEQPLFYYNDINHLGLPPPSPAQLLHPMVNILPFPAYFRDLYKCICQLKECDQRIQEASFSASGNTSEKQKVIKLLARDKVKILHNFLDKHQGRVSSDGLELVVPYVEALFEDELTAVPAVWTLFNIIGQELGPKKTKQHFLLYLIKLFSGENSTPKHMKIYHRLFLIQMILRLKMDTFLSYFSTLLVEAVSGYRNYVFEELFSENQDNEAFYDIPNMSSAKQHKKDFLPPVEEEAFREDNEEDASTYSELSSSEMPKETDTSEFTQDDVDDIDSEVMEKISLSNESDDENDYNDNNDEEKDEDLDQEDERSKSASEEERDENNSEAEEEENADNAETASIHSISNFMKKGDICGMSGDSDPGDTQNRAANTNNAQSQEEGATAKGRQPSTPTIGMVRSETDEFAQSMSERTADEVVNISDVAAESIKWLSQRLGPFLTAKYLSRNLIRMLNLCYLGDEQVVSIGDAGGNLPKTSRSVIGDKNARKILECLSFIAIMYGEQVILLQYIPCVVDLIRTAKKRLTQRSEAGIIGALVLIRHIVPLLSDVTVMDILKETLVFSILTPVVRLVSSDGHSFPGGSTARAVICHKLIDVIFLLGLRIGFENTRQHLTDLMVKFFAVFDTVHGVASISLDKDLDLETNSAGGSTDDSFCNITKDNKTNEYMIGSPVDLSDLITSGEHSLSIKSPYSLNDSDEKEESPDCFADENRIKKELADVFGTELATASFIPFCRIFGSIHMEQCLGNEDLIRQLCLKYDDVLSPTLSSPQPLSPSGQIEKEESSSIVTLQGNQIKLQTTSQNAKELFQFSAKHRNLKILQMDPDDTRSALMEQNNRRHLRGNWLAYWEHELGLSERDTLFNFKQIHLQTFTGHTNGIRAICNMDIENSFFSASKDKTVKLWSIKSVGDGGHRSRCQWTYRSHKKSVFSVVYLESLRLVASCDSTVHIWDPFQQETVRKLESPRYSPVTTMAACPAPSHLVITATNDGTLRFLDLRMANYAHEFKCTVSSPGLIRCLGVSPDNDWVAVGYSSGIISWVDMRTGLPRTWKAHEGDILQLKAHKSTSFLSTSVDQTMKIWSTEDYREFPAIKGQTEPVHCLALYKDQIISGSTSNKIGVHASVDSQAFYTGVKLKSDTFRGVLTAMSVLPLNKNLLLGCDNGTISLFC